MHNEDENVFNEIIVAPTPQELSELPLSEQVVDVPGDDTPVCTTAELVAIYSLLKAGYTAEDFA